MDKTFVPIRTDVVLQNETAQLYRLSLIHI